jgi:hypothetical protein
MLLEHLIYSAALAIIVGMIFMHYTGKDPSWIILLMTIVPDVDYVLSCFIFNCTATLPITHGDFHNILALVFLSLCMALVLSRFNIQFTDALICSGIGFGAHLVEDALVYKYWYSYLYPLDTKTMGWGIMTETRDLFGWAGTQVLLAGIIILCLAVGIRMYCEDGWMMSKYVQNYLGVGKRVKLYVMEMI